MGVKDGQMQEKAGQNPKDPYAMEQIQFCLNILLSHFPVRIHPCISACLKAILHGSKATLSIKHSAFFQTRRSLPPPLSVPFHWYLYLSTELATFSFTQSFPYLPEINSLRTKSTPLALSPQPSVCGMNNKAHSRFQNYFKYTLELKISSKCRNKFMIIHHSNYRKDVKWENEGKTVTQPHTHMHTRARQSKTQSPSTWTWKESIGQLVFLKIQLQIKDIARGTLKVSILIWSRAS